MVPVIYYRDFDMEPEEKQAMEKYFVTTSNRVTVGIGKLVIPRYSALPFYKELEEDINLQGSVLINTYSQHCYVADMRNWAEDLGDLTFKTWYRLEDVPDDTGPLVLKGQTNSRKHLWNTHMFARTKADATQVYCRLLDDALISTQEIYVRQYEPLERLMTGVNGLPVSTEFRFFVYKGIVLAGGFYWASHADDMEVVPSSDMVPRSLIDQVTGLVGNKITFYVIDVAKTESGEWKVVELNDGCMSGLSCVDPDRLYYNLKKWAYYE